MNSMQQTSELNTSTTCSPPLIMSSSLKGEHELQTNELTDRVTRYTPTINDQTKVFRGTQRTTGMPVSVVYKVNIVLSVFNYSLFQLF